MTRSNAVLLSFLVVGTAHSETTHDPVGHYVSVTELYQYDKLFKVHADINNDGFEDTLISSTNRDKQMPKGIRIWDYYLSDQGESYHVTDRGVQLAMAIQTYGVFSRRVESLDNEMALVSSSAPSGGSTTLFAYYFEGRELKSKNLGTVPVSKIPIDESDPDVKAEQEAVQLTHHKTITVSLKDALSSEVFEALPAERAPDFYDLHNLAPNPDDRSRKIATHKATGLVVGNYKYGVFFPLEYPYGSDEKEIVDASDKLARASYAEDVRTFLERREACDHLRGEDAYDYDRAKYLFEQQLMFCKGTDDELRSLKEKYHRFLGINELLDSFDAQVEPEEWIAPQRNE